MSDHALLTGFPGFIAKRLVRALLAARPELTITALVEARMLEPARAAAADLGGERIELLAGDIAAPRLGLSETAFATLAERTTGVLHLAAIYSLAVPLELAERVNIEGTGNVLGFCEACPRLRRLDYVSTAYVAGARHGVVYEHELVMGQAFKNHYESTKFQAEVWVRERMGRIPTTIHRPAIVVGDSRTGDTQKFDGPYFALRAIARSVRTNTPIVQFGRSGAPFNVVPVDFVVDAITALSADDAATGATLHLVDPEPLAASELLRELSQRYAGKAPAFRVPGGLVAESLRFAPVRAAFGGAPRESIRYLNHAVRFDTRQAERLLGAHGLRVPRFPEYAGPVVDFFRAHEDDPAFVPA